MHTLIVGNQGTKRRDFVKKLLDSSGTEKAIFGYRTTMQPPNADGNMEIHIHPISSEPICSAENLVGSCKHRHATAFPEAFDSFSYLLEGIPEDGLIVIDEIGPMEEDAHQLTAAVLHCLDGDVPVLASVRDKETAYLQAVRNHPNAKCFFLGQDDEALFSEALEFFMAQLNN